MSDEVEIQIRVTDDGTIETVDRATASLENLERQGGQASESMGSFGMSLTDLKSGFDIMKGGIESAAKLIDNVNGVGVAAIRAKAGFEALAGTRADEYLTKMGEAAKGLVDDSELAQIGMRALSSRAVTTGQDLSRMAEIGATLGLTFKGSAEGGVASLERALEMVGNTRGLRELGINTEEVKTKFEALRKTMNDQDAWRMAVLAVAGDQAKGLSGNLDGVGTSLDRLKVKIGDTFEAFAEKVATGLENTLKLIDALNLLNEYETKRNQQNNWQNEKANTPAVFTSNINANYIQEFAKNTPSQAGYGFASLGITPGEYFRGLGGGSYGDAGTFAGAARIPDWALSTSPMNPYFSMVGSYVPPPSAPIAFDTSARTDMQDYFVRHPDMRYVPTYASDDPRNNYLSRRDSQANDHAVAMENFKNILHLGHDAVMDFKIGIEKTLDPLAKQHDALAKDAERRASIQSIDDAFGVKKDGLYSEVGGNIQQGLAERRAAEEQKLAQKYGKGSKKYEQGLENFDAQAKNIMDQYNISTGQATVESTKFRDIIADLNKKVADGKISVGDYASQMQKLADAAKNGNVNINNLIDQKYEPDIKKAGRKAGNLKFEAQDEKTNAAIEGMTQKDPLAPMRGYIEKTKTAADDATTAIKGIPDAVKTNFDKVGTHIDTLNGKFDGTLTKMKQLLTQKSTFVISIYQNTTSNTTQSQ